MCYCYCADRVISIIIIIAIVVIIANYVTIIINVIIIIMMMSQTVSSIALLSIIVVADVIAVELIKLFQYQRCYYFNHSYYLCLSISIYFYYCRLAFFSL